METSEPSSFLSRSLLVTFLGTFIVFFVIYIRRNTNNVTNSRTASTEKSSQAHSKGYPPITPLKPFNWETTSPLVFRPFKPKYHLTMAISPLDPSDLIPMDKTYFSRLSLRKELLAEHPDVVRGVNLPDHCPEKNRLVEEALCEWYAYVIGEYLPKRYPDMFRLVHGHGEEKTEGGNGAGKGGTMLESLVTGLRIPIDPVEAMESYSANADNQKDLKRNQLLHLLDTLGTWVDEDFLILLPSIPVVEYQPDNAPPEPQYHLEVYTTYYPAGFDTRQKIGRPLSEIHRPVPGYKQKLEKSMDRFFEKMEVGKAVVRVNWSIMTKGTGLFAAFGGLHEYDDHSQSTAAQGVSQGEIQVEGFDGEETYLRCERQTLHRLPKSKALLFAFHTYAYPLQGIKDEGLGEDLAVAIDGLKEGNVPEMFPYKRGEYWGEAVKAFLRS